MNKKQRNATIRKDAFNFIYNNQKLFDEYINSKLNVRQFAMRKGFKIKRKR